MISKLWRAGFKLNQFVGSNKNSFVLDKFKNFNKSIKNVTFKMNTTAAAEATVTTVTKSNNKIIGYWLAGCSGMVACAVALGGVTRLTESGLSMTEWRLIKDMIPPKNEQVKLTLTQFNQFRS